MHSVHPGQKLTEEEVAIHKEEYLGVLGKEYAAKEQEKRLKIDLTRLKDDAASIDNSLFFGAEFLQAMLNVVIRHYVFIVTWFLQI